MLVQVRIGNYVVPQDTGGTPQAPLVPRFPVVASFAQTFARKLAFGVFAVHNFVGGGLPQRKPVDYAPVIAQVRTPLPRVRSVVGTAFRLNPSPVNARWTHAVVAQVRTPLPKTKTVVGAPRFQNPSPVNARWTMPVVVDVRTPLPRVRSWTNFSHPTPPVGPVTSKAHPVIALVRSLTLKARTFVQQQPHIVAAVPAAPRPRPTVALVRTPLPRVSSFEGPQGRWFLASHERWTRPVVRLIRIRPLNIRSVVTKPVPPSPSVAPLTRAIAQNDNLSSVLSGLSLVSSINASTSAADPISSADSDTSSINSTNSGTSPIISSE